MVWDLRDDGLYVAESDDALPTDYTYLCQRVEVLSKRVDLISGYEECEVGITTDYAQKRFRVKRSLLTQMRIISELTNQGLSLVDTDMAKQVILDVLFETEKSATVIFTHCQLGFREAQGKVVFLGHTPIGELTELQLQSTYAGHEDFCPKGSLNQWRKFMQKHAASRPELCLVLALGATAPVAHILRQEGVFTDIPLWGLIGTTSTGKTVSLHVLGSFWARPEGRIQDFHATENAFFAMLEEHAGIPFLADEATYATNIDWNSVLYSLPSGRAKRRCKKNGNLAPPVEFTGAVFVTSEVSILERSLQHGGQKARVTEFSKKWTSSAEEADTFYAFCAKCYGWAGPEIVRLLLAPGFTKKLVRRFKKAYAQLLAQAGNALTGVDHRILKRFALILASAWVFQKALKLSIQPQKLEAMLLDDFKVMHTDLHAVDPADRLLKKLAEEVLGNQSRYPPLSALTGKSKFYRSTDLRGATGYYGNDRCVWFLEEHFRRVVQSIPGLGIRKACHQLLDKQYIVQYHGDRFLRDENFGVLHSPAYCVLFPDSTSLLDSLSSSGTITPTSAEAAKHLNSDPFGVMCDYGSLATCIQNTPSELLFVRFERFSAQEGTLVLNTKLYQALKLRSKVYFAPLPDQGILLLSSKPLHSDLPSLNLQRRSDHYRHSGPIVNAIPSVFGLEYPLYSTMTFTDVAVESQDNPVAVINLRNTRAMRIGSLCGDSDSTADDISTDQAASRIKDKAAVASQIQSLLAEDDDD